jgi:hypothetical protein
MAEDPEIPKEQVEALQNTILEGVQSQFPNSGFLRMNVPYDLKDPPSPEDFANSIKQLVAQSVAIGVVQYMMQELPKELPNLLPDMMQSIFDNCTVEVKDAAGQVIGTGTIKYTKPVEGK